MKNRSAPVSVTIILLCVVTLLSLGLRLYRLDGQSLWYDEAFSAYLAQQDLDEITAQTAADIQPPLYYYLLHGWTGLFGDSERSLRALSLLFGVLTVPLIYGVAWQLFRNHLAAFLAAVLLAVSPLHVWYGQEARMYTLLTFLCLLSSYFLLLLVRRALPLSGPTGDGQSIPRADRWSGVLWVLFTLVNVVAIYTHYFALFVIAFQVIFLGLVWWGLSWRPVRLMVGGLVSGLVTLMAYLPWLPHLLRRYGADASYWPGQLKLNEVLIDILLSFSGGESILEQEGVLLAAGYGLIFVISFLALLFRASIPTEAPGEQGSDDAPQVLSAATADIEPYLLPPSFYPLLFLLLYLLLPIALIVAFSYNTPKFNARYVMVSHPGLLLVLAGGLAALGTERSGRLRASWHGMLAGLAFLFALGVSAYADYNAYRDPAFARADFRGVARYLEEHLAGDETVILSSGHMFPAFDYYAPDIERHLLPNSPTLDTTQTLDYSVASSLNRWLADRGGVWLVLWQYEVVDPAGYLTTILAEAGELQPVEPTFAKIDLRHYRFPDDAVFSDQPDIDHPAEITFGNRLRLLGYSQTGDRQVTLFWQAMEALNEDYRVSIILRDTVGQSWGQWDGRPTAYLYPTNRWPVGEIVFGRYDLALEPGSPPGDYGLEVGVYTEADPVGLDVLDAAGAPQGKRAMLGAVRLSVPAVGPEQVQVAHPVEASLGNGLTLLGWDLSRDEAQPGDRLLLTLAWGVEANPQDCQVRVFVSDIMGQAWNAGTFPPTNMWHPPTLWLPGQAWRGLNTFRVPIRVQPGEARLFVQLVAPDGSTLGPSVEVSTLQVMPTERVFSPPKPQAPRQANFGDQINLVGADLDPVPAARGATLRVTLYWQARVEMDVPYTVFVHLLGADNRVVAGHDGEPVGGTRPTTGWVPGEYVADAHDLSVPVDLPPGAYVIEVGLYDAGAPNMPRLPILGRAGQAEAEEVIFGPVEIH